MSDWDRINRIELAPAEADREIRQLTEQRDLAREIAVILEQENAAQRAEISDLVSELETVPIDSGVVMVPFRGTAT